MNRRVFFKYLNYIMTILLITLFIFYDSLAQFRDLFPLSRLSILFLWIVGILLSFFWINGLRGSASIFTFPQF